MLLFNSPVEAQCISSTLDDLANLVLISIRDDKYECVIKNIVKPELKFPGGNIAPEVRDSLGFKRKNKESYYNIARSAVFTNVYKKNNTAIVYYIKLDKKAEFFKNRAAFRKREYMKSYFACSFVMRNGRWMLTKDFCYTESDE